MIQELEDLPGELLTRLDALAAQLGVTLETLWAVLAKQGTIEGIKGLLLAGLGLAFLGLAAYSFKGWAHVDNDSDVGPAVLLGGAVATVIGLGILIGGVSDALYILNPEYFALVTILRLLR